MNTKRISSVLASGALALGLCATVAAQAADSTKEPQDAGDKAAMTKPATQPVAHPAKSTVTRFTDLPARASKVIGTEVVYASGDEFCTINDIAISSTGQVVAILERPDDMFVAVPLSDLSPQLKGHDESKEDETEHGGQMTMGKTPEVKQFTLRCERKVCDSAPTINGVKLIDGAWLARSTAHFKSGMSSTTPAADKKPATESAPMHAGVTGTRAPILLKALMGQPLETAEGVQLGEVDDVALDLGTGMVSYVIISTGGLLGVGESLHAIGFDTLTLNPGSVSIVMNKDSFSKLPKLDMDRLAIDPVRPVAMQVDRDPKAAERKLRN